MTVDASPPRTGSRLVLLFVCAAALAYAEPAAAFDPAGRVDVFAGTDAGARDFGTGGGAGNTFPGAVVPFGMVQLSPDTSPGLTAFGGGYDWGDRRIKGFSLKHMSGPGCAAYQDLPLLPTTLPVTTSPAKPRSTDLRDRYLARFSHAHESGEPGSYRVTLDPGGRRAIDARLTATARTGAARFTFPGGNRAGLLLNASGSTMGASRADVRIAPGRRELSGSVTSGHFCYQANRYRLYWVVRSSRPFASWATWRGSRLTRGSRASSDAIAGDPFVLQPLAGAPHPSRGTGTTAQTGAYVRFGGGRTVELRVGLSFVSVAAARRNLAAESGNAGFSTLRDRARATWNDALGRIAVRGGTRAQTRLFYTMLYHALIHPSTFSDADGRYVGFDGRVRDAKSSVRYADFSGWDTYRTQMPLLAMLFPRRASDMVRSLVGVARETGYLPKWPQANGHTHVMVGDPSDLLIAGAYAFGARSFDVPAALAAMVRGARVYGKSSKGPPFFPRPGLPQYLRLGYVPQELNIDSVGATFSPESVWGTAATTMEYALADFAIARLAGAACDRRDSASFARRSGNWRHLFDSQTGYVQPRLADGSFARGGPASGTGFVEGNSAQYTLFVPHDPAGLFAELGGRAASLRRLDAFFTQINAGPDSPHAFLGNEPTIGMPWLYTWLGRPYRAQAIVRRALLALYRAAPDGYPGNDDLGALSSWWVFGALGLYPAVPGTDVLAVGTPLFKSATLRLPGGRLALTAPAASARARYVSRLTLDGRAHSAAWLRFARIRRGARLRFDVAARPNRRFGSRSLPPSYGPSARVRGCR